MVKKCINEVASINVAELESEIYNISSVTMRDGTTHNISDLVTYDREYLYFPIEFGPANSSSVIRLQIPLKTLKDALDQVK